MPEGPSAARRNKACVTRSPRLSCVPFIYWELEDKMQFVWGLSKASAAAAWADWAEGLQEPDVFV